MAVRNIVRQWNEATEGYSYRFKGGDVRIFLNLMQNPDWTSYYLSANYRNAKNIMDIAKTVIKQADDVMDKLVYPTRFEMGEGLEKKVNDLAAEVAKERG